MKNEDAIRVEVVCDILASNGLPAQIIQMITRGKLVPEAETADDVAEPRNRRVETPYTDPDG